VAVVAAAAGAILPAGAAPPSIADKQREATAILAEIDSLDSDLNRAVESYDGARLHLTETQSAIRQNTHVLGIARQNLKTARKNIAARLVALYTRGQPTSALEIILGARSLPEALASVDAARRISGEDAQIAHQAQTFQTVVTHRQHALVRDRARAERLVRKAEALKRTIEASLAQRQDLLASVKGEIARMQAAEQRRQLLVAAQARARLAAEARARQAAQTQQAAANAVLPVQSTASSFTSTAPATQPLSETLPSSVPIPPPPPPSAAGNAAVGVAMRYLGVPYVWGGASPAGFDCSGFTMYVYAQLGVSLPHYSGDQWVVGTPVARDQLEPGDLVFFDGLGHEGIYIGNNEFVHAPHTGDVVKISSITGWYEATYMGARRV
jgi:cell wall-associated NlpC family hydrolase